MSLQQNLKIIPLAAHRAAARRAAASDKQPQRIVIDFSSPNIAKPFHFGHLKSTILGNFIANLNQYYGHQVTRLNYIGDWGTQYGLLSLGLDTPDLGMQKEGANKNALERLLAVYVAANARGIEDENFYQAAKQRFRAMESGQDAGLLAQWQEIRSISLEELKGAYEQLGVSFDVFEFESDYARRCAEIIEQLKESGHLKETPDGAMATEVIKNDKPLEVPVMKSDGSSLYLTRDIVAARHRKEKYQFDRMYYVVGASQEKHFHCLREIVNRLGHDWAKQLMHVKTGKVKGMSSRTGEAVLLSKIIEEATRGYEEMTRKVPTSKVSSSGPELERVGQQLALSALYVFDMRNKRTRDYQFDWHHVMVPGERSGIHLQTTYARLNSLRGKALEQRGLRPFESLEELDYDSVRCIDGVHLINVLNELPRKLDQSYQTLDPCPLVNHALLLSKASNRARQSDWLHVLHETDDQKARSRLSLFESARAQLDFLIRLIGLEPLERV